MPHREHPWVVYWECRQCRTTKRFTFQRAWHKDGCYWASHKDTEGHEDYGTVTRQVYAQLTGGEDANASD